MQTDTKFIQWENKTYFLYLEKACDNLCSSFYTFVWHKQLLKKVQGEEISYVNTGNISHDKEKRWKR